MLKRTLSAIVCSAVLLISPINANANLVTVSSGFSALPTGFTEADFNGDGIPNDPMSWNLLDTNGDDLGDLLIAIGASQRYSSPLLTDDGSGNFFATTGNTICPSGPTACTTDGPRWNFNVFIESLTGPIAGVLDFLELTYELDPNTSSTASLSLLDAQSSSMLTQFSWNLGFEFLNTGLFFGAPTGGVIPAGESFNRFNAGTYDFSLQARQGNSDVSVDMSVTAVNSPSTLAIFGIAVLSLVGFRKRQL